ncbi:MAG: hypothetical protein R3D30_08340 [Hyphomicrobiales bacterium]
MAICLQHFFFMGQRFADEEALAPGLSRIRIDPDRRVHATRFSAKFVEGADNEGASSDPR